MVGFFVSCAMPPYPEIELIERITTGIGEDELLQRLLSELAWRDEPISMFGKTFLQPRRVAWYGDSDAVYRYSGIYHHPLPWAPVLLLLRRVAQEITGEMFNSVLCNLYRDGNDAMGYHSDSEPELGSQPVIASFSIGAVRTLHFRHATDRSIPTVRVSLPSMSFLIMRGSTQQEWKHALPRTKKCTTPRVNLTFRYVEPR